MRNWPLIDQIEFYVHLNTDKHEQNNWIIVPGIGSVVGPVRTSTPKSDCGVKACIAGWATLLAPRQEWVVFEGTEYLIAQPGERVVEEVVLPGEGQVALTLIEWRAPTLLGLTIKEAAWLFDGENSRKEIRHILNGWREQDGRPRRRVKAEVKAYRRLHPQDAVPAA